MAKILLVFLFINLAPINVFSWEFKLDKVPDWKCKDSYEKYKDYDAVFCRQSPNYYIVVNDELVGIHVHITIAGLEQVFNVLKTNSKNGEETGWIYRLTDPTSTWWTESLIEKNLDEGYLYLKVPGEGIAGKRYVRKVK